ncbi:LytR/AlgR family response regulator transcription factor [Pedobacter sandarakinus]|uniref:LytR/AlgR family response regulator transcription factor n=1 Tax=Pedobacter sandarakinus TaxID=353156 RepID=UPI002245957A|nr:LytTR family DNA-binding domain-containing protein [Pedobacter sandarakinus]MCX2575712.1 LytTR family DNA-binding domain-containing protein [Pedobacter sandarakinus]
MEQLRCVVIDDEKHSISILSDYIETNQNLTLVKTYLDPLVALSEISIKDKIDFIFLDIDMPSITGIELAKKLVNRARFIVFTTAFTKYAVEAFEVDASRYLVKPISKPKFIKTVWDILESETKKIEKSKQSGRKFFFVSIGDRGQRLKIKKSKILFFESEKNYINIVTEETKYMVYLTMKEVEKDFWGTLFYRVHRSFFVNAEKVEKVIGNTLKMGSYVVPMGNSYKDSFNEFLERKTLRSGR